MTTSTPTVGPATTVAGPARSALLNNPYGLSLHEVRAEIRHCAGRGWQLWEIRLRFATSRKDRT